MKYFQWYITSYQSLVQHQYICPGIYPATNNFSILNPFTYICWHRDGKGRSISVLWSGHCPGLGRGVQGLYGQGHEVALIYLCPLQQGLLYWDHHLHLRLQKKKKFDFSSFYWRFNLSTWIVFCWRNKCLNFGKIHIMKERI